MTARMLNGPPVTAKRTASKRRNMIAGATLIAGALMLAPSPAAAIIPCRAAGNPCGPAPSLPRVSMHVVLKAAQWDPRKSGKGITHSAKDSVLRVERALVAKGYLRKSSVDGHFGSTTVKAFARWQRRLGYSGIDASGLPGKTSLVKLGRGRFVVGNVVSPGRRTKYAGQPVNARTKRMLKAVTGKGCTFTILQGSWHPGNAASAGTHDGGGAVDIGVARLCGKSRVSAVRALRRVGFAAWYRPADGWREHIHAIAISDPELSSAAQHQVGDYYEGRNGLRDRGPDGGPKVPKRTWEEYTQSR